MLPMHYHSQQRAIQHEASTTELADQLSTWVGPVVRNTLQADLILLAHLDANDVLRVTALSGTPPLVSASEIDAQLVIRFPQALTEYIPSPTVIGGLVINPGKMQRSRIYGTLQAVEDGFELRCQTASTNCRKYIYPSVSAARTLHFGATSSETRALDDVDVLRILACAVTSFVVTIQPNGVPDVSHRGGEPGFLEYDPVSGQLEWTEYYGDGLFLSAGNIRATGRFTLIALDLETGDALELVCIEGGYRNLRPERKQRVDALIQNQERYEVQGKMSGRVASVRLLRQWCHPRQRINQKQPVLSCSTVAEQHPE